MGEVKVYNIHMPYKNREQGLKKKREYHQLNKEILHEKKRIYYQKNREYIRSKTKKYYRENLEKIKEYKKKYAQTNKEKLKEYKKKYQEEHYLDRIIPNKIKTKEKRNEVMRRYRAKRIKTDPQYRLSINLRNRIRAALKFKNKVKTGSAILDLGCTPEELKKYLEHKFNGGMSWKNYGRMGWHVDHIKSLKEFDLTDRKQFLEACHYTNLQPLWWQENLAKRFK